MNEKMNGEEIFTDEYISNIHKEDIPVPEELEERILKRIESLKPGRNYSSFIIAACAALCILLAGSIRLSPQLAVYAASVPVLRAAVEWLTGDSGIENAKVHGYEGMDGVTVEEDGYTLDFSNIVIDEDRIYLSVIVSGDEVYKFLRKRRQGFHGLQESKDYMDDYLDLLVEFPDFKDTKVSVENPGYDEATYARNIEMVFEKGEAREFMKKSSDFLNIKVKLSKGEKKVHEFETIKIPLDPSDFMESKIYEQDYKLVFDHTNITIGDLIISPTRMKLDINCDMEDGYTFSEFENPYLMDDKGNKYMPERLVSNSRLDMRAKSLYFIPSIYFDKMPEKLHFCYDGIRIARDEGRKFRLALDDEYPKTIIYMGREIVINNVSWRKDKGLSVECYVADDSMLEIKNLRMSGYHDSLAWSNSKGRDREGRDVWYIDTAFYYADKQEIYEMELELPGYLIADSSKLELRLN